MELKYFTLFVFLTVSVAMFSIVIRRIDEEVFYQERRAATVPSNKTTKHNILDLNRLKKLIGMSGFTMTLEKLYIYKIVSAAVFSILAIVVFQNMFFFLPAACGGFFIPNLWLKRRKGKRQDEILTQLPETLERISNYMRSGSSFITALDNTQKNESTMEPMKTELLYILADIRKGMTEANAMSKAAEERITLSEFKMVSLATQIHTELGGNMPETLENISRTIKDKSELIETIRASTTEARLSGWIVGIIPIIAFLVMKLINPSFIDTALKEPIANLLYAIAFVWDALGLMLTRKLSDVSKDIREPA